MAKSKRRDRQDIIADILSTTRDSARKTRIMFGANLSFDLVNRYLAEALKAGLISTDDGQFYFVTERGKEFLKRYNRYARLKRTADKRADSINAARADLDRLCWGDMSKEGSREVGSNQDS